VRKIQMNMIVFFACMIFISWSCVEGATKDIINIIAKIPIKPDMQSSVSNYLESLTPSDVPVIYDVAFDETISEEIRIKAIYAAIYLKPDQTQIDRMIQYFTTKMLSYNSRESGGEILLTIKNSIIRMYNNTDNDKLLSPFRSLYESSECNDSCKNRILQLLGSTKADKNIALYNKIMVNAESTESHKAYAAFGMAQSGSLESIKYLRKMAEYLFDKNATSMQGFYYMKAVDKLGILAKKYYEASLEVQKIITRVCEYNKDEYSKMMDIEENVYDLFDALEYNEGEGNRKYLERLLTSDCKYPNANRWIIRSLGYLGNEGTIEIIGPFAGQYPILVNNAIAEINKRIGH
jgi:hypothetical protein